MDANSETIWLVPNILPDSGLYVLVGKTQQDINLVLSKFLLPSVHIKGDIFIKKEVTASALDEWLSTNHPLNHDIKICLVVNKFDGKNIAQYPRTDVYEFNGVAERHGMCIVLIYVGVLERVYSVPAYIDGVITVDAVDEVSGAILDINLRWEERCKFHLCKFHLSV